MLSRSINTLISWFGPACYISETDCTSAGPIGNKKKFQKDKGEIFLTTWDTKLETFTPRLLDHKEYLDTGEIKSFPGHDPPLSKVAIQIRLEELCSGQVSPLTTKAILLSSSNVKSQVEPNCSLNSSNGFQFDQYATEASYMPQHLENYWNIHQFFFF